MSIPTVPSLPMGAVGSGLLASVALEEVALAHLVNAEAEKTQKVAGSMPAPSTFAEVLEMQKTLLAVLNVLVLKEMLLLDKVRAVARLPVPHNCPKSQRFWRAHPDKWPVTSLVLGLEEYGRDDLLTLLETPSGGNASRILARQLIAAKLSIANGSDAELAAAAVRAADALLGEFPGRLPFMRVSFDCRRQMVAWAHDLEAYNLGHRTPACIPWR